jgi:hypothetical protein
MLLVKVPRCYPWIWILLLVIVIFSNAGCSQNNFASDRDDGDRQTTIENKNKEEDANNSHYHLELTTDRTKDGIYIDFYLQDRQNLQTISNANVIAEVELPTKEQIELELVYDEHSKHYTVLLPQKLPGLYQVRITANLQGEIIKGFFSFNQ